MRREHWCVQSCGRESLASSAPESARESSSHPICLKGLLGRFAYLCIRVLQSRLHGKHWLLSLGGASRFEGRKVITKPRRKVTLRRCADIVPPITSTSSPLEASPSQLRPCMTVRTCTSRPGSHPVRHALRAVELNGRCVCGRAWRDAPRG